METLIDIWNLLKTRKKFWLLPLIIVLIIISALLIFGSSSSLAPFIYTLF